MKRLGVTLLLMLLALAPVLRVGAQTPDRDRDRRDRDDRYAGDQLQISRALYGDGRRTIDVTGRLNAQIRDGHLSIAVMNETMGGDPARNKPKKP